MVNYGPQDVDPRLAPNYIQEVTKTITLALAPYVPFSQRYTMEMQQHAGGKKEDGFFNILPTERSYDAQWNETVANYLAREGMTVEDMGEEAPNVDHLLAPMAKKLSALLDAMPGEDKGHQKQMESSIFGELVGEHSMEYLREAFKQGNKEVGLAPDGISDEILNSSVGGLSKQGIDVVRTNTSEPFFKSLNVLFGENFNAGVAAAEVTDTPFKKEISQGQRNATSVDEAITIMNKRIDTVFKKINTKMATIAKDLTFNTDDVTGDKAVWKQLWSGMGSTYSGFGCYSST